MINTIYETLTSSQMNEANQFSGSTSRDPLTIPAYKTVPETLYASKNIAKKHLALL